MEKGSNYLGHVCNIRNYVKESDRTQEIHGLKPIQASGLEEIDL